MASRPFSLSLLASSWLACPAPSMACSRVLDVWLAPGGAACSAWRCGVGAAFQSHGIRDSFSQSP